MNSLAPIVLFVYDRPDHTRFTVESLKENQLATESNLVIFSDAAKDSDAEQCVQKVREYLKTISGFRTVTIIERNRNFGLSASIIDGVSSIVNNYGKVIVVEDDLITSKYFLQYMNEGLTLYQNDLEVISLHGYVYPVQVPLPETFFICGADCWGWATWKRGWDIFQSDGRELLLRLKEQRREFAFDWDGQYGNLKMLKRQISGEVNSWAIRWHASAFLQNKLTLYPGISLVNNIGGDQFGTHTKSLVEFQTDISRRPIQLKRLPMQENMQARQTFVDFFKTVHQSVIRRIIRRIVSMVS
ncbi:MAG: hypothetical protein WCX28_01555 [Bacteriovoracaceae bacterium]